MSSAKIIKKGDYLFKEGDKITCLMLIQQGAVSICVSRPKKNVDLFTVGTSHVLGEQALSGATTHPFSAIALQETKVLEIPVDMYKGQVEGSHQTIKVLVKSLADRLKITSAELKSGKMEKDSSPCPEDQVAKIFGTIFHTARHKGQKLDDKVPNKVTVEWTMMKQYAQRIFVESPRRLEQAISILVKLKLAEFEMGRPPEDPEGPEQIMKVHFFELEPVEAFFEFYQYYYFKGTGKSEILKADDNNITLLNNILSLTTGLTADRYGIVQMDFIKTIEKFKADFGINLNNDHFTRLEQKGLFAKRSPKADGTVVLSFELKEFQTTQKIWRIIKEIEKWNDKGFVDINEEENLKAKKKAEGPCCGQCGSSITATAKFCPECGSKIAAAA